MHTVHTVSLFINHTPCHRPVYHHEDVLFSATEGKDPLIHDCSYFPPVLGHLCITNVLSSKSREKFTEGHVFSPP